MSHMLMDIACYQHYWVKHILESLQYQSNRLLECQSLLFPHHLLIKKQRWYHKSSQYMVEDSSKHQGHYFLYYILDRTQKYQQALLRHSYRQLLEVLLYRHYNYLHHHLRNQHKTVHSKRKSHHMLFHILFD